MRISRGAIGARNESVGTCGRGTPSAAPDSQPGNGQEKGQASLADEGGGNGHPSFVHGTYGQGDLRSRRTAPARSESLYGRESAVRCASDSVSRSIRMGK